MIKSVFVASLAAVVLAAPEADPALLYGHLGYAGVPLAAVGAVPHVPVVKAVVETPAEVAAHALPVALGYHGLGYGGHFVGKRSADADPAILAGSTQVLTPPTPIIHNPPVLHHAVAPLAAPLAYGLGYGHGYGLAGAHYIGKRAAEADPQLLAGLPYAGLAYGYGGLHLAAAPAVPQ